MKNFLSRSLAALASLAIFNFGVAPAALAQYFDGEEVDQNRFVAIAVPGTFGPKLLILEQKADSRSCWSESGDRPTIIEPLLLDFDFSGICGRATDSNGYSIRMADTDLGMTHALSLKTHNGEIFLLGISQVDAKARPILIGRTYGLAVRFVPTKSL